MVSPRHSHAWAKEMQWMRVFGDPFIRNVTDVAFYLDLCPVSRLLYMLLKEFVS